METPSMENQADANKEAATRQMIHLQVAGEHSQDDLVTLITQFQQTLNDGGVIATPSNVVASVIETTGEVAGLVLTPKLSALEIAAIIVESLRGFDIGQGNEASPSFVEIDQDAKVEILNRIQFILRYGSLLKVSDSTDNATRDAIFEALTRALGTKLTFPSDKNLITVTRIAQKEGDEDFDVSFKELVQGDIFKHGDGIYIAESSPYVNWIAHPLPIITIDAKVYEAPAPVAPEDVKGKSKPSKKKVQSKPSNSTAKARKK
jgi:hypothetical protein